MAKIHERQEFALQTEAIWNASGGLRNRRSNYESPCFHMVRSDEAHQRSFGRYLLVFYNQAGYTATTFAWSVKRDDNGVTKLRLSPAQCRMARAALQIGIRDLAERTKVSPNTIARLERGDGLYERTIDVIRQVLEAAGCIFIDENGEGPGVRLRKVVPAVSTQTEALEDKIATIPEADEPSPEAAMNVMRKALAANDLANLKGRQPRSKRK